MSAVVFVMGSIFQAFQKGVQERPLYRNALLFQSIIKTADDILQAGGISAVHALPSEACKLTYSRQLSVPMTISRRIVIGR